MITDRCKTGKGAYLEEQVGAGSDTVRTFNWCLTHKGYLSSSEQRDGIISKELTKLNKGHCGKLQGILAKANKKFAPAEDRFRQPVE